MTQDGLSGFGKEINAAFSELQRTPLIDDKALDLLLKGISSALLSSDVNVTSWLTLGIESSQNCCSTGETYPIPAKQKQLVHKTVFDELVALGSGKTTSCTKLAVYYRRKGFKTALVCADTFRAGAFDQLKQNATKAKIPFYGSHTETDPISILWPVSPDSNAKGSR
ncbi:hypothetical protein KEM48_007163 [Puccinia striiformis f. sp. tritici PST-130]|nr:hypothetical protein KEM48_007163 [Puccinia striiformis f. sp. tritici PST-130]